VLIGECPHPDQTSEIGEDDRSTVESTQMKKAKKNGKRLKISEVFAPELVGNHRVLTGNHGCCKVG
jgi:hypothetical protein